MSTILHDNDQVRGHTKDNAEHGQTENVNTQTKFAIFTAGGESKSVAVKSIKYFEVQKKIITVRYNDDSFEFYSTLNKLEKMLVNDDFVRLNKAYLVAINQIKTLTEKEAILIDGTKVALKSKKHKELDKLIKQHRAAV